MKRQALGWALAIGLAMWARAEGRAAEDLKPKAGGAEASSRTEKPPDRLEVYTNGHWKGFHAVYQHPNFDALVDADARITIYPKEKGERVGKPLTMGLSCYYVDMKAKPPIQRGRAIQVLETHPKPTLKPDKISLEGELKDEVKFELNYAFTGSKISAWGYCDDPKKIDFPTVFRIMVSMAPSHTIPPDMPVKEQKKLLAGYAFIVKPVDGKEVLYPYYASVNMGGHAKSADVKGPVWGARRVSFEAQSPKDAPLVPWIYSGLAPWQGYHIYLWKAKPDSKSSSEKMHMEID